MSTDTSVQGTNQHPIICGTDFSEPATDAANVASVLAQRFGEKLVLVHVDEHSAAVLQAPEVIDAAVEVRQSELNSAVAALRSSGAEVEAALVYGDPHRELVATAEARQARLIVVAAVGRSRRLLMGSVAVRTAETSPVPTLVVRQGNRISEWAQGKSALRIILGYDFSAAGDAALDWVRSLMKVAPCELNVVHINWPPEERERLGVHGPVSLTENDPEIQRSLEQKVIEKARTFLGENKFAIRVLAGWGRVDSYLTTMASEENTDLLILGSHQRHLLERFRLGSVSRAVLNTAPVSVVIIPVPIIPESESQSPGPETTTANEAK